MMPSSIFFFFNDTATTEIYTLSLHDALPISIAAHLRFRVGAIDVQLNDELIHRLLERHAPGVQADVERSEEHTSELQSQSNLVCRLLLEKKKDVWLVEEHPASSTLHDLGTCC